MILSPRKLLDRLLVACPNVDHCQDVMPRCDLHAHLIYSCRGTKTNCVNADLGCNFQGTRGALQQHIEKCLYNETGKRMWRVVWTPIQDGKLSTVEIYTGCYNLGISIVGGVDTPLKTIVIQEVFLNGAVYKDGRLLPGDQLIEVNGIDLMKTTHCQAVAALSSTGTSLYQLVVYRETADCDVTSVQRRQSPLECPISPLKSSLGTTEKHWHEANSDISTEQSTTDDNDSSAEDDVLLTSSQWTNSSPPGVSDRLQLTSEDSWPSAECRIKVISVSKSESESLGIGIAGGRFSCGYDTPIYVTNIQPEGCLAKTGQICKGDVLIAINGTSLLNLTHNEAVRILKSSSGGDTRRVLHILQVNHFDSDRAEHATAIGLHGHQAVNFRPMWTYWLSLPSICYSVKTITLERSNPGPIGFSVVTSKRHRFSQSANCNESEFNCSSYRLHIDRCSNPIQLPSIPVFVKSVMPNSPAGTDGRLRSGDIILSIDGQTLDGTSHSEFSRLLARWRDPSSTGTRFVVLTAVSWPGSPL